jgi:hypothetical protein
MPIVSGNATLTFRGWKDNPALFQQFSFWRSAA